MDKSYSLIWGVFLIFVLALFPIIVGSAAPRIVVLANDIDYDLAGDFFGFLDNKGLEVVRATADNFEEYKTESFIIILGGPDAYDGVGGIVGEILSEYERDVVRTAGNRRMFVKTDPWGLKSGQRVTVLAGSDRQQTKSAHEENRGLVAQDVESRASTPEKSQTEPREVQINIQIREYSPKDTVFEPTFATISRGSTVVWVNKMPTTYTVIAVDGSFDSGPLRQGESFSYTFNEVGTFQFEEKRDPVYLYGQIVVIE